MIYNIWALFNQIRQCLSLIHILFRFILPNALIRTAGGREVNLRDLQAYALKGGLNGIMVGGYLTTGGRSPQDDLQMIQDLELTRNTAQV